MPPLDDRRGALRLLGVADRLNDLPGLPARLGSRRLDDGLFAMLLPCYFL